MNRNKKSKEIIYKLHNIKSNFKNAIKIHPKRNSQPVLTKEDILLLNKCHLISNADTACDSAQKANKKICIKYKDLSVETGKSDNDSENHLELALIIKKRKNSYEELKMLKNNIEIHKKSENKNDFKNKSLKKVILGNIKEENFFIKSIKKRFCCL